jgi:hypothetical protein
MADDASVTVSAAPAEFANAPAIPMPAEVPVHQQLQAADTSMLDMIKANQGQQLWQQAQQQYPYLSKQDIAYVYSPIPKAGYLETFDPVETGDPTNPLTQRPTQIPLGKYGIQVRSPQATPEMIMADAISHIFNQINPNTGQPVDPAYYQLYQQFAKTMQSPEWQQRLAKDYETEKEQLAKEKSNLDLGTFQHYIQNNRIPAYMRGYVMKQWDDDWNKSWMSQQQQQILDQIKSYFGIK